MRHIPNIITVLRIFLIPVFINFLIHGYDRHALVVLIIAGLSDMLDGLIARTWGFKTRLGAFLDPIADKLLLVSSFITLAVLKMIPPWVAVVIVGRDFLIGVTVLALLGIIDFRNYNIRPSLFGKAATVLQVLTILVVLSGLEGYILPVFFVVTAALTIVSGLHYIFREIGSVFR